MLYKTNKISGWMSDGDLQWLFNTAKEMESVVEIGSWKGRSTHALLSGCKGDVYAVDHFLGSKEERDSYHLEATTENIYEIFIKNVGHFKNLHVLKTDSNSAVKFFEDKSIDMAFIDGGHTYDEVVSDIKLWLPKIKKIICGHDWTNKEVKQATLDTLCKVELNNNKNSAIWFKKI